MNTRVIVFAVVLLACAACIVVGAAIVAPAAAWIVAGLLGGIWAWLVLSGDAQ